MKILVGLKHVPDTETKVKLAADGRSLDETGVKWVVSPFDEYALECALQLRDAAPPGEVIVVSVGRDAAQASLRQGLAVGADRAIHVRDERYETADALTRCRALAAVARASGADLVLLGKYGVGADEGLTAPMLAELLDWPHVSGVCRLEIDQKQFKAEREVEGAVEAQAGQLPAVISCDKGLNEPRYASLKGIMAAKKKSLDVKSPQELGLDEAELDAGRLIWESLELPPPREPGRMIDGAPADAAVELARLLRDEAKVI